MLFKTSLSALIFLCCYCMCSGQAAGCFSKDTSGSMSFETSVDFNEYSAFFVGEFHGMYDVPAIKLALIKYLHKQHGVTDVFMEIGHSTAWLYNQYLQTGDTALFTTPAITYAQKQQDRNFWKQLYAYNKTNETKIAIHGMDFERMTFFKTLKLLMPAGKQKPSGIATVLNWIDTGRVIDGNWDIRDRQHPMRLLTKVYDSIQHHIANNRSQYEAYYGASFKDVARIMFNENTYAKYADRNRGMYANILKEVQNGNIKKYVVFAGLNHANRQGGYTLCAQLVATPGLKDKLATIAMVCNTCYDWQQPKLGIAPFRGAATYAADTAMLSRIYRQHFDTACTYTLLPTTAVRYERVADFSQYLLLVRDQPEY